MATASNIKGYKVLKDEVTIHQTVNSFERDNGSMFHQNDLGKTHFKDEVVDPSEVDEFTKEVLSDEDHPLHKTLRAKLRPVKDEPTEDVALRIGLPFAGYDSMEEDQILVAMSALPSETIQRIKEYESKKEEPRERITDYNIGYGESPTDRQLGLAGSEVEEPTADGKEVVANRQTRATVAEQEDGATVQQGEGVTGVGLPQSGVSSTSSSGTAEESGIKAAANKKRSGRRSRSTGGTSKSESSTSGGDNKGDSGSTS